MKKNDPNILKVHGNDILIDETIIEFGHDPRKTISLPQKKLANISVMVRYTCGHLSMCRYKTVKATSIKECRSCASTKYSTVNNDKIIELLQNPYMSTYDIAQRLSISTTKVLKVKKDYETTTNTN